MTALAFGLVLITSVAVWLSWAPVKDTAGGGGGFTVVVLSTAMACIFLGGMTSLVFSLLPVRFLDGEHLWSWRRAAWLGLFGVGMFLFVHVALNRTSLAVAVGLFVAVCVASTAFCAYFRFRRPRPATAPAVG